uniref:Cytoplasmic aconitate hydratase n=1 Tax=Syphacia muris TaxID=451379 RepID=A0A0N5AV17_9BILA
MYKSTRLPISIRYLLESAVRNCDGFAITENDVQTVLNWQNAQKEDSKISFIPARVLLQDFTGVPAVLDLAAMRDAVKELGGDPSKVNPICPVDLVIDHSVQVDYNASRDAVLKNQMKELERNKERFQFLKWGAKAFKNLLIVPPGSGICHQINLEYLSRLVLTNEKNFVYPDFVVGTDSHTTMNAGSGVLAWGVGGIEAEAVMLGQPISMVVPKVVGFHLIGNLTGYATSTDLVLTITEILRASDVVGKFIEFYGTGVNSLSIADRATISNMSPEYGATVGFFPPDAKTLRYYSMTGREKHIVNLAEEYLRRLDLLVDYENDNVTREYLEVLELDLNTIVPCVSGPKRPHDRIELKMIKNDFQENLTHNISFKGFGIKPYMVNTTASVLIDNQEYELKHGSVVISAITSCTNTSNPSVMLGAGLLAKKAIEAGLYVPKYVKTSLSPGSHVVKRYLEESHLLPYLEKLGYGIVGYGCMTCIGNCGLLHNRVVEAIEKNNLVVAAVLSGNRNFEGRIHVNVRANYLASPLLVVAFGLAGRIDIDFDSEPIVILYFILIHLVQFLFKKGVINDGPNKKEIFLRDIWPTRREILDLEEKVVKVEFFRDVYHDIREGSEQWKSIKCQSGQLYTWDPNSTYIKKVPFFGGMSRDLPKLGKIKYAFPLLVLGDSITTDHISPAGAISKVSPAAKYLLERGVSASDFNTYGSRRGNDEIMARGTYANIRLVNKMASKVGPFAVYLPTGDEMSVYDVAERYRKDDRNVIIIAGKEYGCGSSRDWAAKGPYLLGVKAVIAESFERIHRSVHLLIGSDEAYTISVPENLKPGDLIPVKTCAGKFFIVLCRFDTEIELTYYKNGGILPYMVRKLISN